MAAFLLSRNGRVLDIDERSAAFLRLEAVLGLRYNRIWSPEPEFNAILSGAIERVAGFGKAETLICLCKVAAQTRYAILLQPDQSQNVACMVFPLGRRRIASALQLMSLFGLSAAEARLARALCHGETLEEYAEAQGVKLPHDKDSVASCLCKNPNGQAGNSGQLNFRNSATALDDSRLGSTTRLA